MGLQRTLRLMAFITAWGVVLGQSHGFAQEIPQELTPESSQQSS